MSGMTGALAEAVGMGLLHFAWIGLLIGAILVLVLSALRGRTPQLRYAVALAGFIVLACVPVATISRSVAVADLRAGEHVIPGESWTLVSLDFLDNAATSSPERRLPIARALGSSPVGVPRISALPLLRQWAEWARASSREAAPWIAVGWLTGVAGLGLRLLAGMHYARGVGRRGTSPLDLRWQARLDELTSSVRMRRSVRVFQSTIASVPLVVGWFRPVILMPATLFTGLPAKQVELLLAHELAHIKRLDPLVNLFQVLVETLLFFHPVVWWLSRRIREERELCCDDFAVELCGGRADYAQALLQLAESTLRSPALALSARGGTLRHRINRVLGVPATRERMSASGSMAVVMLALCGLLVTGIAWAEFNRFDDDSPATAGAASSSAVQISEAPKLASEAGTTPEPALDIATSNTPASMSQASEEAPLEWPPIPYRAVTGFGVFDSSPIGQPVFDGPAVTPEELVAEVSGEVALPAPSVDALLSTATMVDAGSGVLAKHEGADAQVADAEFPSSGDISVGEVALDSNVVSAPSPKAIELHSRPADESQKQLLEKLAEPVNMEFVDMPADEFLRSLVDILGIDIRYILPVKPTEIPVVKMFEFDEGNLSDALEAILPQVGLSHWVGPGYLLVGTPEQIASARDAAEGEVDVGALTRILVNDHVSREHVYTVLERWARRYNLSFFIDPYVVGAVDGPDGDSFETDGIVAASDFNAVPMSEALFSLLAPLGLGYIYVEYDSVSGVCVSTPERLENAQSNQMSQAQIDIRVFQGPTQSVAAAANSIENAAPVVLGDNARVFHISDGNDWEDATTYVKRNGIDVSELISAPRLTVSDHHSFSLVPHLKVMTRSDNVRLSPIYTSSVPVKEKAVEGTGREPSERRGELQLISPPYCVFPRGGHDVAIPNDFVFRGGCGGGADGPQVPSQDALDPLSGSVFRRQHAGVIADLTKNFMYPGHKINVNGRVPLRSGRRGKGTSGGRVEPESMYHAGFIAACSVARSGAGYDVAFFSQYRETQMGEVPWRAFQCDYSVKEGEVMGFVSPSELEGMSVITLVRVTPVEDVEGSGLTGS